MISDEVVSETKLIVYNKTLDTNLWNDKLQLDPQVRKNLLQVAQDFYDSTDLQGEVVDVFLIGSSANYNWTPESDLDVHVIIDISQEKINPTYARKFMDGLTWAWNSDHEIEVMGHPVEVYLQDQTEPNGSEETARPKVAIFSLKNNEWVQKPIFGHPTIDKDKVKFKFRNIRSKIEKMVKSNDYSGLKSLMKRIKNYRNTGLKERGEFSTENLVFKALRHTGMLEKLKDGIQASYDKSLSLSEAIGDKVFIITGMTAQDLDVAGEKYSENEPMVTHGAIRAKYGNWSGSKDWRYRSDINTLFWWGIPDEDEKQTTLDWLERKYNVRKPRETTAQGASEALKAAVHYPWMKKGLRENVNPDRYYIVGVVTDDLNVIAKRYNNRENYITHEQLRTQYGADWGDGAALWRYHSYGNWIFWWSIPSKEQKEEVLSYLHSKYDVSHPKHETDDTITKGTLREVVSQVGKPFLIVGLVNANFQVVGARDYGKGDAIGSHSIEHEDREFDRQTRGRFDFESQFSHWRYKSKNNTLYWWIGDEMSRDMLDTVLDYLHTKYNVKNPQIDRNKEHYFEDAHFVLEMICEGNEKDWVILGNIDDDLKVNHVKKNKPSSAGNHTGEGKRWRFRTTLPYVFWWAEPTKDEGEEVEYYLYKNFGYKIKQHRNLNDYEFNVQAHLHGDEENPTPEIDEVVEGSNFLILGTVNNDYSVIGWKTYDPHFTHGDLSQIRFPNRQYNKNTEIDLRWRYRSADNTIYWGGDIVPDEMKESVENYLNKNFNIKNPKHNTSDRAYWRLGHSIDEMKFNPYKAKELQFVTYGGLSLTKQKGFSNKPGSQTPNGPKGMTFHSPPARRGIYAFVWPYIEKFLLGGGDFVDPKKRGKGQRGRIEYLRDKEGNVITNTHPDYEKKSDIQKNWSLQRKKKDAPGKSHDDPDFEWDDEYYSLLYRNTPRKKFSYNGPLWHHLKDGVKQENILDEKGDWIKTDMATYKEALKKDLHQMNITKFKDHVSTTMDHMEVFIDQKI